MSVIQIKVERANVGKTQKGKDKTGLYDGKQWYNIMGVHDLQGKTVKLESTAFPNFYNLKSTLQGSADTGTGTNGNGKHKPLWEGYKELIRQAHEIANELEPDIPASE